MSCHKLEAILDELAKANQATEKKKKAEEEACRTALATTNPTCSKAKNSVDKILSDDYHAAHLARQPILTYQQYEDEKDEEGNTRKEFKSLFVE